MGTSAVRAMRAERPMPRRGARRTLVAALAVSCVGLTASAAPVPAVNASGVFNTNGLTCPETEVECERCPAPLNTGPFHAPVNLTGVRVIGCRYRADVCDALREETRAWKTKCKEQRTTLVTRTDALEKRFVDLQDRMKKARAKRAEGGAGDDLTTLELDLTRLKSSISHAFDEVKNNRGGVPVGAMSDRMESFVTGPSSLDTTNDMLDVVDAMNAVLGELQKLHVETKNLCSYDASVDTSEGKIVCEGIEKKMKLSEKRVNRCASRLGDFLTSTAKIDALLMEKTRRFSLLDSLDKYTDSFAGAWSAVHFDHTGESDDDSEDDDDDDVLEPSARFNLTEHVTTGIVSALTDHYTIASARRALATAQVDESALCAHIIPRMQLSLLGNGLRRGDIACPPPHGTYIAGRELPDWSAYFLFLIGVVTGVAVTIATNHANGAVEFLRTNSSIVVAVVVVVAAGRFF